MASSDQPYRLDQSKDYPFVQSTEEHDRLNEQSLAINEVLSGKISHAPLESPTKILDVGCGTGIQTMLLAELYPDAMVIGIDPNPVPTNSDKPNNVVYVLGKIEELAGKHELLQPGSFDLVYQRYIVMVISDWTRHIEGMRSLLKPNGWIECQESNFCDVYDANNCLISSDWRFPLVYERGGSERGMDFRIGSKLRALVPNLGFTDVASNHFPQPWLPGYTEETERLGRYGKWAAPPMINMLIRRSVKSDEDAEELIREADEKMLRGPIGTHIKIYVTVGRKVQ